MPFYVIIAWRNDIQNINFYINSFFFFLSLERLFTENLSKVRNHRKNGCESMSEQIPLIKLELENLAWHGTRLQLKDENITKKYGLAMELGFHFGKQQYMNTIYFYNIHHNGFPYTTSLITYMNVFAKSIEECLEDSTQLINIFFVGKYQFVFSEDQSNWIKKAY